MAQNSLFGGVSLFGKVGATTPTFGANPAPATAPSLFGGAGGSGLFGGTQTGGMFGSPSAAKPGGLFAPTTAGTPSTLFSGAATAGGSQFGASTSGSSLFGGTASGSLFGGATAGGSLLGGGAGLIGQQNTMIAPTNFLSTASLSQPPPAPVSDSAHLLQAFQNPAGFSESLFRDMNPQELTTPVLPAHIPKRTHTITQPYAVPLEKWRPGAPLVRPAYGRKPTCDLLDIEVPRPKTVNPRQAVAMGRDNFHEWLASPRLARESQDSITVSIKGLPGGTISLPRPSSVYSLQRKVCTLLRDVEPEQLRLWYKGQVLESSNTLAGLSQGAELLYVVDTKRKAGFSAIVPDEDVPVLTRPEYCTSPSMVDIARMSAAELRTIDDFTISNHFGSVEFPGRTDLTALNLDRIVQIGRDSVVLYPEGCPKPRPGEGLNRKAKVTIFNRFPKSPSLAKQLEDKLRKICLRERTNFHSYDPHKGLWVFTTNPL